MTLCNLNINYKIKILTIGYYKDNQLIKYQKNTKPSNIPRDQEKYLLNVIISFYLFIHRC